MDKLIEFEKVNVCFEKNGLFKKSKLHVLKDIDLTINRGEILAVVGESGCGKTTIGRLITGLLNQTSGKIGYFDKDGKLLRKQDKSNDVQFVQQDSYAALNPVKTIYQSLRNALQAFDKKRAFAQIDTRIHELMELVGLVPAEQFLDKFPYQLSGGQRQRILMARAMCFEPTLIVADEPVSMIDVSLRLSILKLMRNLNEITNISFVYITHDLATARYIASNGRICVLYLGEIMEVGEVNQVLEAPQHPYTRALLQAVPNPDPEKAVYDELPIKSMDLVPLDDRPVGCSFYNRCPYAMDKCKEKIEDVNVNGVLVKCCNIPK